MSKSQAKRLKNEQKSQNHKSPYTMSSRLNPVATRLMTRLKYCDYQTLTTAAGPGFINYDWNLNGLFDPNLTGTGHQPRGFDQLAALYNRYRVFRTRWEITFSPLGGSSVAALGCVMCSNAVGPATFNDCAEQTFSVVRPFSYPSPITIRGSIDLAKLNGKTHQAYMADDTTQAIVSANPVELLVLHTSVLNCNGASDTYAVHTTLWFDAEFSDPNQLGQS